MEACPQHAHTSDNDANPQLNSKGPGMSQTEYEGRLFIDGEFREAKSGRRYDVLNPADDSVVAAAADAGPEDVHDAIAAASIMNAIQKPSNEVAFRVVSAISAAFAFA